MGNKKAFTVADLRNCYTSMRKVWEPFARKAVDDIMKGFQCPECVALDQAEIVGEYATKRDNTSVTNKRTGRKRPVLKCPACGYKEPAGEEILDTLEALMYDQDAGFETFDEAVEAIAAKQGKIPEKRDWVGEQDFFTKAWNKTQNRYFKDQYGIDASKWG